MKHWSKETSRISRKARQGCFLAWQYANPHAEKPVKETLEEITYDMLGHPLYLPNIESLDYHLFRSLQGGNSWKQFSSFTEICRELIFLYRIWKLTPWLYCFKTIILLPLRNSLVAWLDGRRANVVASNKIYVE